MSIATLKRKTKEQYNNSSVGRKQFSLNGVTRNQGWIGQTFASRSVNTPYVNNNNIIKPSTMSNNGMIQTKHRWIRRPQPFSVVKSSSASNINLNSQSNYITHLQKYVLNNITDEIKEINKNTKSNCTSVCHTEKRIGSLSQGK